MACAGYDRSSRAGRVLDSLFERSLWPYSTCLWRLSMLMVIFCKFCPLCWHCYISGSDYLCLGYFYLSMMSMAIWHQLHFLSETSADRY